eukprot:3057417-Pyramimonas_sp.AAC.1
MCQLVVDGMVRGVVGRRCSPEVVVEGVGGFGGGHDVGQGLLHLVPLVGSSEGPKRPPRSLGSEGAVVESFCRRCGTAVAVSDARAPELSVLVPTLLGLREAV